MAAKQKKLLIKIKSVLAQSQFSEFKSSYKQVVSGFSLAKYLKRFVNNKRRKVGLFIS